MLFNRNLLRHISLHMAVYKVAMIFKVSIVASVLDGIGSCILPISKVFERHGPCRMAVFDMHSAIILAVQGSLQLLKN